MDGWRVETGVKVLEYTFTAGLGKAPGPWDVRHQGRAGLHGQVEIFIVFFFLPLSSIGLFCI